MSDEPNTPAAGAAGDDAREAVGEAAPSPDGVIHASKLMRIASMTRAMLEEVRQAPLDADARRRLTEVYERTFEEMEEVLNDDLREELADIFLPLSSEEASDSEIRIAQAQLVGWLEGLFAGIQASLFSQQAAANAQLQQMRMRAIEMQSAGGEDDPAPGQYL
ncbi:MAG: bacterial proteasome activator family protein [Actinobacteria bacterium]|nr:bacterial proteasome activator family protein [Actinomycetota bacterium]